MEEVLNEREARKQLKRDLRNIFETKITDENIRQYIFGKSGYDEDNISNTSMYIQYFKNVMSLSFFFAYACYRCDADSEESDAENLSKHNSKRIINSLKNAYVKYPVTSDLIQFVLTDIQFEMAQGNDSELKDMFVNLCSSDMSSFSFNPYLKLIAEYDKNPSRFQGSGIELMQLFLVLLNKMTFLSEYALKEIGPARFCFERVSGGYLNIGANNRHKYDKMILEHVLFKDKDFFGSVYRLFSLERGEKTISEKNSEKQPTLCLKYLTPAEEWFLSFTIPEGVEEEKVPEHLKDRAPEEVFSEITGQDGFFGDTARAKKNTNKIDLVHTVNYKYTKNLALAISDAISSNAGSKKFLYDRFNKQYPYIFEHSAPAGKMPDLHTPAIKKPPYEDDSLDWDTVVIMLLIEASPSVVLEYIIRKVPETFYDIVKNLQKRFFDAERLTAFGKKRSLLKDEVNNIIQNKLIVGEAQGFGKIPSESRFDRLFSRGATMFIISNLSKLQDADREENLIYTGNLHSNITLLKKIQQESENEKKIRYSCIILGETFKHLICFYSGLFEYGKYKAGFDMQSYEKCVSRTEIAEFHRGLEKAFMKAASEQAQGMASILFDSSKSTPELVESSLKMFEQFILFCKKCKPENNTLSDHSKNLYSAIGKYEISNITVLNAQYEKLKVSSRNLSAGNENIWANIALDTLEFLKTGSFSDTARNSDLFSAVYPFTAVFNRGKENSDGYKTINFSLNIDIDEDSVSDYQMDINVLSEFSYTRTEVYYCLPNVLRSNYKWWIDPVMVSFRDFNNIFQ